MNAQKMFVSLIPWLLFSSMIHRHGANAAGVAALFAASLAAFLMVKGRQRDGFKIIDVTGLAAFGVLAAVCFAGGSSSTNWVADYGRGASALVLAAVMLGSVLMVPFSEQYARETVPSQYWSTAAFRSVNRHVSTVWGVIVLVMAAGHLMAGKIDPATKSLSGPRPVDLILNWVLPIALITLGVSRTKLIADGATREYGQGSTARDEAHARDPLANR